MSKIAWRGLAILGAVATTQQRWARSWHRRLISSPVFIKWFVTLIFGLVIGYADLASGNEVSFSIFYMVPIAYATWFLRTRDGMLVALFCTGVWLAMELAFADDSSSSWIVTWNAAVRLAFFVIGIMAVALMKQTTTRLLRGVLQRTRGLRDEAARRRKLERDMIETSAREQLRLAQDLHDGLGQYLSALAFHSRMLADDLQQIQSTHVKQAERIVALVRKTNQITRQLNRALQIPDASEGGLLISFRALVFEFEQLTGIKCEIALGEDIPVLDQFRTVMLFRIVQEALNNSVKHARPRVIRVALSRFGNQMIVSVVNDGHEIGKYNLAEAGTGSLAMKLRADLIGARLEAGPTEAGAYKVECVVPING